MKNLQRILIVLLISLLSVVTGQINVRADDVSYIELLEQNRLVVFEAFMRPT